MEDLRQLPIDEFDPKKHSNQVQENFWIKVQAALQESFQKMMVGGYALFIKENKMYLPQEDVTQRWKDFLKVASQDMVQIVSECLKLKAKIECDTHPDGNLMVKLIFTESKKK